MYTYMSHLVRWLNAAAHTTVPLLYIIGVFHTCRMEPFVTTITAHHL